MLPNWLRKRFSFLRPSKWRGTCVGTAPGVGRGCLGAAWLRWPRGSGEGRAGHWCPRESRAPRPRTRDGTGKGAPLPATNGRAPSWRWEATEQSAPCSTCCCCCSPGSGARRRQAPVRQGRPCAPRRRRKAFVVWRGPRGHQTGL